MKPRVGIIKRRKPLPRSTKVPHRNKPPKAVNSKRKAKNFERAHGGKDRVEWGKQQPCVVMVAMDGDASCEGPIVNAHVGNEGAGMGRKANADQQVSMCDKHHKELDDEYGPEDFQFMYCIDLDECMIDTERSWQEHIAHD